MKTLVNKLIGSFDTVTKNSFSARKLTAFAFVFFCAYIHKEYVNEENAIEALLVDSGTALLCLGIITFEQVIKFKNGESNPTETNEKNQ